jgi:ribosomal protein S12 methylthiotransferase accessory factor
MQIEHLAKRIGVSRLADVTGLDHVGLPVVAAIRPLSCNLTVSFGKGLTREIARISAVMEAAELHFSEPPPSPLVCANYDTLRRGTAIDPRNFEQIESCDVSSWQFNWIEARVLNSDQPILVPWQTVSMDFSTEARKEKRVLGFGATGQAADFVESRAVLHGLYEVIERDAHNSWNRATDDHREQTMVDLRSVRSPEVLSLMDRISSANLELLIWDMTSRTGIPCYLAEVFDLAASTPTAYVQGAAADLSPDGAIQKAIAEALQVRLTYISGSRDDLEWSDYGSRYDHVVANRYWVKNNLAALRKVPAPEAELFKSELVLAELTRQLEMIGCHQIIVVRLTAGKDPVKVVKVIVPFFADVQEVEDLRPAEGIAS